MTPDDITIICWRAVIPTEVPGMVLKCGTCKEPVHVARSSLELIANTINTGHTATVVCAPCFGANPPKSVTFPPITKAQLYELRHYCTPPHLN